MCVSLTIRVQFEQMRKSAAGRRGRRVAPPAKVVRASKKEAQLLATAEDLFKRYGIKRVSVTEICAAAGVSKVTFYKFFPDKVALAKRVLDDLGDRNLARIDEIEARDVPFPEKVAALIEE